MRSRHVVVQRLLFLICLSVTSSVFAQENLPDIVERISPSIVVILTYDEKGDAIAQGSGFFINESGDVITNYHVIEGASSFDIKTSDGKSFPVTSVLAEDLDGDLAVLAVDIPSEKVRALSVNSVLPRIAESIIVIGCPLGLELTVSDGIVSAVRNISSFGDMIQITAPISPGSSGGPVVDMNGKVIGVAMGTMVDGQNLNFAIPSERVSNLVTSVVRSAPKRTLSEPIPNTEAAESLYQAGLILGWAEEYEKALGKFLQVVRIKPDFAEAFYFVGYCYVMLGRNLEALQAYERTIELRPENTDALNDMGTILDDLGRWSEALQAYDQAIQVEPDHAMAWCNKGGTLTNLGRYSQALQACEQAVRLNPGYAEAWFRQGMALGALGRSIEELQAYEKAIQLKPDFADALYNKGMLLRELGRYSEALQAFEAYEKAIQLNPDLE